MIAPEMCGFASSLTKMNSRSQRPTKGQSLVNLDFLGRKFPKKRHPIDLESPVREEGFHMILRVYTFGQIITTSAEVTLNCGLVRESPKSALNSSS